MLLSATERRTDLWTLELLVMILGMGVRVLVCDTSCIHAWFWEPVKTIEHSVNGGGRFLFGRTSMGPVRDGNFRFYHHLGFPSVRFRDRDFGAPTRNVTSNTLPKKLRVQTFTWKSWERCVWAGFQEDIKAHPWSRTSFLCHVF